MFNLILNYRKIAFFFRLPKEERARIILQNEIELKIMKSLHKADMFIKKHGDRAKSTDPKNNAFLSYLVRFLTKGELNKVLKATGIIPTKNIPRDKDVHSKEIKVLLERRDLFNKLLNLANTLKPPRYNYNKKRK